MTNQMESGNVRYDVQQTTVIPKVRTTQSVPNQVVMSPEAQYYEETEPETITPYQRNVSKPKKTIIDRWYDLETWKKVTAVVTTVFVLVMGAVLIGNAFITRPVEVQEPQVTVPYHKVEPKVPNANLSLDGIKGQYWSNAQKILDARGADTSEMLVLTNNGKTPIMDSNWKVTSIEKGKDGQLTVHLEQITDYTGDAADAARGAGGKIGQAWNNLVEEGQSAKN